MRNGGPFLKAKIVSTTASGRNAASRYVGTLRSALIFGGCFAKSPKMQRATKNSKPDDASKTGYNSQIFIDVLYLSFRYLSFSGECYIEARFAGGVRLDCERQLRTALVWRIPFVRALSRRHAPLADVPPSLDKA